MALKGQKFKNHDNKSNIKNIILEEYKIKRNIKELSKQYEISEETIKTWTRKFNQKKY